MTVKTIPTHKSVSKFISGLSDSKQKQDSIELIKSMSHITNCEPIIWGESITGFGKVKYKYASGTEGEWMKVGFSPRKGKISLYLTCDASDFSQELKDLGKHKTGKGCIYIKSLDEINLSVLRDIITKAFKKSNDE